MRAPHAAMSPAERKAKAESTKKRTVTTLPGRCSDKNAMPKSRFVGAEAVDFPAMYRTYKRRILSQCFSMLRNQSDAEDVAQEVFLRIFLKLHTFRGDSAFATWLYRLTTNCVLMEIRKKRRRGDGSSSADTAYDPTDSTAALDLSLDRFQAPSVPLTEQLSLDNAMSQLPIGYQRIFELHDVEGHTHEEIARLLGIHAGTSKSQLYRARLRMRLLLQDRKKE